MRYSTLKPVRWILRSLIKLVASVPGTTYGERAEMAGKGPCGRCVGHSVGGAVLTTGPSLPGLEVNC